MGITEWFSELYDSLPSFVTEAHAEAPEEENKEDGDSEGGEEKSEEGGEDKEEGGDSEGGEDGGDGDEEGGDEEEEEEEEEEPVDPKPKLEEDCAKSAQCIGYKHHFDECVERVTAQHEDQEYKGPKEDCVEEFFHLQHCATQCAAPKLFKVLK